jgi:hypothetical protein
MASENPDGRQMDDGQAARKITGKNISEDERSGDDPFQEKRCAKVRII